MLVKALSVKYHELPALLVNEAQRQQRTDTEQQARIEAQAAWIDAQQKQIAALAERLARLEPRN